MAIPVETPGGNPAAFAALASALGVNKNNFAASADPSVTDDGAAGYAAGSRWMRSDTGDMWTCRSATNGAAVWVRVDMADFFGYVAGNWYVPQGIVVAGGSALSNGTMRFIPLIIKQRCTITALGVRIATSAAGGNIQLALYAADPTTKRPTGNALRSTASITTASTGVVNGAFTGGDVQVNPGLYWVAINADNGTVVCSAISNTCAYTTTIIGSATQGNVMSGNTAVGLYLSAAQTFGTWPDMTAVTCTEQTNTAFALVIPKIVSVP